MIVCVGPEETFRRKRPLPVTLPGGRRALVIWHEGRYHAMYDRCPHAGGSLADARLGDGCLTCPWHGWTFHLPSGISVRDEACRLNLIPYRIVDNMLYLDLKETEQETLSRSANDSTCEN